MKPIVCRSVLNNCLRCSSEVVGVGSLHRLICEMSQEKFNSSITVGELVDKQFNQVRSTDIYVKVLQFSQFSEIDIFIKF